MAPPPPVSGGARERVFGASAGAGSRPLVVVSQPTLRGHTSRVPGGADEGLRPLDPQRCRAEAHRIAGDGFRRDGQSRLRRPTRDGHGRVCGSGGGPVLRRAETGAETQGIFRTVVADVYGRQCAVTREKAFPALEAAHIRPFKEEPQHYVRNGLLLRSDIHKLFDAGYVTVTPDYQFEVSDHIHTEPVNDSETFHKSV